MNKYVYEKSDLTMDSHIVFYNQYILLADGNTNYNNRWVEHNTKTNEWTPCKWNIRLAPCATMEEDIKYMDVFKVVERLDRA